MDSKHKVNSLVSRTKAFVNLEASNMKKSRYNYICSFENQYAIFNTFTTSVALLSEQEYNRYLSCTFTIDEIFEFHKLGILIDDAVDEFAIMEFDRSYFAVTNPPRYRILTTTACNAHCPYCYEHGVAPTSMTFPIADKIVQFIEKRSKISEAIQIEWFGGELLVNVAVIDYITQKLKGDGYNFHSSMVSNGLLFTPELISRCVNEWNLEKIQITIDGSEKVYESIKGVPSGSFFNLLSIIELLTRSVFVSVRMNVGATTKDFEVLIDQLSRRFNGNKNIFFYFYPLFENKREYSANIFNKIIFLNNKLIQSGVATGQSIYNVRYKHTRCFATNYRCFTIAPDGKLYNCSHIMNQNGLIGSVESFSEYNSNRLKFVRQDISDDCKSCILFPLCKGGCRAAELKEAPLNQCMIYKSCFDVFVKEYIQYHT